LLAVILPQKPKNPKQKIEMKQIITILAFFQTLISLGQVNVNDEVKKDFTDYFNLIAERKIDEALNYTNPKLFEIVPKEQMKNLMQAVYKMSTIEYKTGNATFLKFDELKNIENVNYVKFLIISPIEMKFTDIENTEEKVSQMTKNFEAKFGVGNVEFDKNSGFYKINAEKVIIASSDNELLEWKFVTVDNPKMKALLEKFIPKELLE
jgi:hypothetical protein